MRSSIYHKTHTSSSIYRKKPLVDVLYALRVVGIILLYENIFVAICVVVSLAYGELHTAVNFLSTAVVLLLLGTLLMLLTRKQRPRSQGYREGALAVVLTWSMLSLVGMLPFLFGGHLTSVIDAFFETVSGFTTTGFSTFSSVEQLPRGILLWRGLLQWQGGIGIVVFTMGLSPLFTSGGGLLFSAEASGIKHERFLPHIREVAKRLGLVYTGFTLLLIGLLVAGRMPAFDAVCHALATISTGGFTTRDANVAVFGSRYIEYVLMLFMVIGSLNIPLMYKAVTGRVRDFFRDEELRWFLSTLGIAILLVFLLLLYRGAFSSIEESFRYAAFQVISINSSTGFFTSHLDSWGSVFVAMAIPLMLVCGCAGSTTSGIKMSRFMVMMKNLHNEFRKRIHPSLVARVRFNGIAIANSLVVQVLAFISLYLIIVFVGTILFSLHGYSFTTSFTTVVSAFSNIGYGFREFACDMASAGGSEKLLLTFLMLAGRLEVFTLVGVLLPSFYKR